MHLFGAFRMCFLASYSACNQPFAFSTLLSFTDSGIIGDCKDMFCNIIYSTENIISFSSGKSPDKSADTAVYVTKIIASENKMRSIHKKKYQISFFCFFHQRVQHFMVEFVLGGCICFSRKRTAFQFFESIFFNSLLTAVTVTVILNLSLIISAIC